MNSTFPYDANSIRDYVKKVLPQRKGDKTIQQLPSKIQHDAVMCDYQSIKDPLDEAMRTRFIWSMDNEAIFRALFKLNDDELTFAKAIQEAQETKKLQG